jgi:hypothetical protein
MKKTLSRLVIAALLASPLAALAGLKAKYPVYVNQQERYFRGSFGSTRNSVDTTSFMSCYTTTSSSGSKFAVCAAQNAAGQQGVCVIVGEDANLEAVRAMNSDAYVQISWDENGFCTEILSYNNSTMEPKK